MVSAKDQETQKWLGQVIAGTTPTSSTTNLASTSAQLNQATANKSSAGSPTMALPPVSSSPAARLAAAASRDSQGDAARRSYALPASGTFSIRRVDDRADKTVSNNSLGSSGETAARRASKLAAGAATEALYHPRPQEPELKPSQMSSASAAATIASQRPTSQIIKESEDATARSVPGTEGNLKTSASKAALLAARDSKPYEIQEHSISQNAGRAALLAAHDSKPYEVPEHKLSAQAGRAALLANDNVTPYEVPEHKLSAYAGKAALQAHQDPVTVEVPKHRMSQSASTAALSAYNDPVTVEVEKHEMSANAGKAALLAHHDYQPVEIPVHELSANAGKAALLASQNPDVQPKAKQDLTSEASARNALKAASQAHHDPLMRPTKPDDLQAKGAASALKAASQAHQERAQPFNYVHPADDERIGRLARENTRKSLAAMEPRQPGKETLAYANISYANAQKRQSQVDDDRSISGDAQRSAEYSFRNDTSSGLDDPNASVAARQAARSTRSRADTTTTQGTSGPVDLLAIARRNVDSQMAARGIAPAQQITPPQSGDASKRPHIAHRASSLAFKDGQDRAVESARHREQTPDEREIAARIAREMAQFDQQRKRNEKNPQYQSALMEAARRNAKAALQQMDRDRPYTPPSLQDIAKLEDSLNDENVKARKDADNGRQIDIGGGHYMSQAEVEAIAAKRVQPVFDEMDERVAAINQRKAEIKAKEDAERERKAAEKAERHKQKELEKERVRNTKIAEKEAKEQAKKEAAEKKAAEEARKREERAAQEKKRQEKLVKEREEREAAVRQKKEEEAAALREKEESAKLTRTDSANAVATAAATPSIKGGNLPGTNAPLPGQVLEKSSKETSASKTAVISPSGESVKAPVEPSTAGTSTSASGTSHATAVAPVEPISEVVPVSGSVKPSDVVLDRATGLERTSTLDSRSGEPLATYVVDHRGMTDTEGETDDEWTDAVEETPGAERTEPSYAQHLHARQPSDGDDAASVKTAKPTRPDTLAVVPEIGSVDKELAPPIVKTEADLVLGVVSKTKFKEEFA